MGVTMADILCFVDGATAEEITAIKEHAAYHPDSQGRLLRVFIFNTLLEAKECLENRARDVENNVTQGGEPVRPFDVIAATLPVGRGISGYPLIETAARISRDSKRIVVVYHGREQTQALLEACYKKADGQLYELPPTVVSPNGNGLHGIVRAIANKLPVGNPDRPSAMTPPTDRAYVPA